MLYMKTIEFEYITLTYIARNHFILLPSAIKTWLVSTYAICTKVVLERTVKSHQSYIIFTFFVLLLNFPLCYSMYNKTARMKAAL